MISLIVLTHNRRTLLGKCLRSLFQQDWPPEDYEIVVVDDGSTDGTAEYVREAASCHPNLRYVCQAHRGIAAARNLGLSTARGELVSFVADDYELAPDYIQTAVRLMHQNPTVLVVRFKTVAARGDFSNRVGDFYYSLGTVKRLVPPVSENTRVHRGRWSRFKAIVLHTEQPATKHGLEAAGGAAFRRSVFSTVGVFDETLQRSEDADMGARLREHNIEIYYYPFHQIRHHYERFPVEALRKSFRTGMNRYRYHRKHRFPDGPSTTSLVSMGLEKVLSSVGVLFYCCRSGRLVELLLYSPFLLLLEGTNKLGYFTAMLFERS